MLDFDGVAEALGCTYVPVWQRVAAAGNLFRKIVDEGLAMAVMRCTIMNYGL
jgi:hypothetical protein